MKVCIVTRKDIFPAVHGAAVKIVRTAEGLSEISGESFAVTSDREGYHRWVAGRHEFIPYPRWLIGGTRVPPRLDRWLQDRGIPDYWQLVERAVDRLGYPRPEFLLYQCMVDPDFWLRATWVGLRHRIDVFQAEFPGFVIPSVVAASVTRARTSLVEHNVEWQRLADTTEIPPDLIERYRKIEVALCRLVDDVIPVSTVDGERLAAAGVPAASMTVLPHGVDVGSFRFAPSAGLREQFGVPEGVPLLFFHGTLHYEPNTVAVRMLAEEILPRLEEREVEVRVVAAGMNPPFEYWHKWLYYPGIVEDLPGSIADADLCVVPLLAGGGTRLKILEYLAAGVPCVSTLKGAEGLKVVDGQEMALVEDGAWDAFCDRVGALLAAPDEAAAMGERAARFAQRFDWYEVCQAYVDLYRGQGRGMDFTDGIEPSRALEQLAAPTAEWATFTARNRGAVVEEEPPPEIAEPAEPATPQAEPVERKSRPAKEKPKNSRRAADKQRGRSGRRRRKGPAKAAKKPLRKKTAAKRAKTSPAPSPLEVLEAEVTSHLPSTPAWTKPRTAIVMLNRRCNLRCAFCDHWSFKDELPAEAVHSLIDQAPDVGIKLLVLTGGEPFLRKDLFEIIDHARDAELGVNITSNGTMLARRIRLLAQHPPHSLSVSIDGLDDTHDRLRGRPGTARRAWEGIERVIADTDIMMNVYFVVTRTNVHELIPVYDRARAAGADFDFWPVNGDHGLGIDDEQGRAAYRAAVEHILDHEPERQQHASYYEYGLDYLGGRRDPVRCLGLVEQFGVDQQGRVVPCCVWGIEDLSVGNVMDAPLTELLASPRAAEVRQHVFDEGCLDRCFNHSLYEFEQATGLPFVVGGTCVTGAGR